MNTEKVDVISRQNSIMDNWQNGIKLRQLIGACLTERYNQGWNGIALQYASQVFEIAPSAGVLLDNSQRQGLSMDIITLGSLTDFQRDQLLDITANVFAASYFICGGCGREANDRRVENTEPSCGECPSVGRHSFNSLSAY